MSQLDLLKSPHEFFHEQIVTACHALNATLEDDLEFYLVNLLCTFVEPPNLDHFFATPLAIQFKEALESSHENQFKRLKQLGDISLYSAGFFQEYFTSKAYDVSYYISMGSTAYLKISQSQSDRSFASVYRQLCKDFPLLVNIIAAIADKYLTPQNSSLLALYEKWLRTGSGVIEKILEERGITPIPQPFNKTKQ